ncbi:MAG TPA: hypothetical protein VHX38_18785 [Pseudonocardiaceae bacterium]|nr:hypothetical protein [Pseudonocardiaceae bacterium]
MKRLSFTALPSLHLAVLTRSVRTAVATDNLIAARAQAGVQLDQLRAQLADSEAQR